MNLGVQSHLAHLGGTEPPQRGQAPLWWCNPSTKEVVMNGSHFDKQTQHERTCSLIHGTWRCAGVRIASVGACALMVGQLLLPSVALATECADPAAAMGEVAAAPVTPAVTEDTAATTAPAASTAPVTDAARRRKPPLSLSRQSQPMPPMSLAVRRSLGKTLLATTTPPCRPCRRATPSCPAV